MSLTSRHRSQRKPIRSKRNIHSWDDNDSPQFYCICRKEYDKDDQMIQCDGCDEWYHPECVGLPSLTIIPDDEKYFCPRCNGRDRSTSVSSISSLTTSMNAATMSTTPAGAIAIPGHKAAAHRKKLRMSPMTDMEYPQSAPARLHENSFGRFGRTVHSNGHPLRSHNTSIVDDEEDEDDENDNDDDNSDDVMPGTGGLSMDGNSDISLEDTPSTSSFPVSSQKILNTMGGQLPQGLEDADKQALLTLGLLAQCSAPQGLGDGVTKVEACPNRENEFHKCTGYCFWRWAVGSESYATVYSQNHSEEEVPETPKGEAVEYGPSPKDEEDNKRVFHNERERLRRSTIRNLFEGLRKHVPAVKAQEGTSDRQILTEASKHIAILSSQSQELEEGVRQLRVENIKLRLEKCTSKQVQSELEEELENLLSSDCEIKPKILVDEDESDEDDSKDITNKSTEKCGSMPDDLATLLMVAEKELEHLPEQKSSPV